MSHYVKFVDLFFPVLCGTVEQWVALLPRTKEVLSLNPPSGPSCVEFGLWEEPRRHKGVESEGSVNW